MERRLIVPLTSLALFAMLVTSAAAQDVDPSFQITGTDPAGDVKPEDGRPNAFSPDDLTQADILGVQVNVRDENLVTTLTLAGPAYFGAVKYKVYYSLYGRNANDYVLTTVKRPTGEGWIALLAPKDNNLNGFTTVNVRGVGTPNLTFVFPLSELQGLQSIYSLQVKAKASLAVGRGTDSTSWFNAG